MAAHLRRQATPFALGLLAIFSFEAIDLFFIAQLGDAPLAAVAFCLPVVWLMYGIGIGFEAGVASCVSRAVGRRDAARAARLTTDSVLLGAGVAVFITLAGLAFIDPVFRLLGATPELMPIVRDYMRIWYWLVPMDLAFWTMLASVRARGNTLLEARMLVAAALLNLALDPIFIFGLFGFPRMEVAGAALATLVSTAITVSATLYLLLRRWHVFAPVTSSLRVMADSWRHLLQIGIPAMVTNAIIPVSSGIVVRLISAFGVDAVAGYGIAMRVEPIALIPYYALSAVTSPFFGQNSGGGHHHRLLEARRVITRFCAGYGLFLGLALLLLAPWLVSLYTDNAAIAPVAVSYLWLVAWSWGGHGMVMSVNAGFNGSGRPLPAVVVSCCRVIVVLLPLAWLGQWLFGLPGLFGAIAAANLLVGLLGWRWLGAHITRMARNVPTSPVPSHAG